MVVAVSHTELDVGSAMRSISHMRKRACGTTPPCTVPRRDAPQHVTPFNVTCNMISHDGPGIVDICGTVQLVIWPVQSIISKAKRFWGGGRGSSRSQPREYFRKDIAWGDVCAYHMNSVQFLDLMPGDHVVPHALLQT
eukprot:364981-Chlamydomonas_euryale.AAC.5